MEAMVRFSNLLLALPVLVMSAAALHADPIPQDALDNSYNSCMKGCTAGNHPQDKCDAYCSCSISAVEEKFTSAEFSAMNSAVIAKQPIPKGSQDKLNAIVNSCRPKLQ